MHLLRLPIQGISHFVLMALLSEGLFFIHLTDQVEQRDLSRTESLLVDGDSPRR
jgi:hypothetical protein